MLQRILHNIYSSLKNIVQKVKDIMGEYSKKLHIRKNGTVEDITLYTNSDISNNTIKVRDGGTICYAPIGAADNSNASSLRVRKDGEIYSVLKQGGIPETTLQCNPGSSITFKVPIGITKIKIQYRQKGVMTTCIVSVSSENTYTVSSKGSSTDPFSCLYILYENSNRKDLYIAEAKGPALTVKWSSAINNL